MTAAGEILDAARLLRERCAQLGLPTWLLNPAGLVLAEPSEASLAGLWLRSGEVARLVSRAVTDWSGAEKPELQAVMPGCWLIGLAQMRRRRVGGYLGALAMSRGFLESEAFVATCKAAHIDVATTRHVMREYANYDEASAKRVRLTLEWMLEDLRERHDQHSTIEGFTTQLTGAYETIDLLYALGRAMNEPNDPEQFVTRALERLRANMDFAWVGAHFEDDARIAPVVHGRTFVVGAPSMTRPALIAAMRRHIIDLGRPVARMIGSDVPGFLPDGGPQVIVQPVLRDSKAAGYLMCGEKKGLDPQVSSYDTQALEAAAGYIGPFLENAGLYADQSAMFMGTLKALTSAIDAKDPYTCGHSERVALLSAQLAETLGIERDLVDRIHIAGLVHDVGKIGVPEHVLGKSGRLTDEEFAAIKLHPEIGHRILRDIPLLQDVLPGVLHHHERWDGRGYPHGLAGEAIPRCARIIGLADTFDAMSSNRAYRSAMSRDTVLAEIARCAGAQFDPAIVLAFLGLDFTLYDQTVADAPAQRVFKVAAAA